jgi:L-alanine-DL-glutamate epimerase-like enolase superfamily enzyme
MDVLNQSFRFRKAVLATFAPIPMPEPFYDATGGPFKYVPIESWVELYDDQGGWGEAPCSSSIAGIIFPLIMTGEKKTYAEWYRLIYWKLRNRGFSSEAIVQLGRFDLALHDLMAKRAGLPLHRFWGAERDWVRVYGSGGSTHLTDEELVKEITGFRKDGYTVIKMKIGTNHGTEIERDIRRIAMVRNSVGKDVKLAIDANQCWNTEQARQFAERVAEYNPAWYEEPVHSADIAGLEKLTKSCPIAVAMGESMKNHYMFETYAKAGVKHLQPVPVSLGGVREWFEIRDIAKQHGLVLSSGGLSQISASYIATASEDAMVEYLTATKKEFIDKFMKVAPEVKNGRFYLPLEPGLPLIPNWELIERAGLLLKKEYFYG